ncbi:dihydrolipoyl dehydrogenase [Alphaproteobacteria bacterium]|nr:dihydrolipoyl dehydrogenase [Alphaproteobacteria bacterium]
MDNFDIAIVGGGPGGYVAAIKASQLGYSVCLFEEDKLGGVCLNWGCIPTKSLLHSAEFIEKSENYGLSEDALKKMTLDMIIQKSRQASENLSKGVTSLMKKNKIEVFKVRAVPKKSNDIFVFNIGNSKNITSKYCILATGCSPRKLMDMEFDENIWSSKEAMIPKYLPKDLIIVGSGAIGIEYASIYNALGANVIVFETQDRILPQFDKDISSEAKKIFEKKGIKFELNATIEKINKKNKSVTVNYNNKEITSEALIVSIGVVPNISKDITDEFSLNLDKSGYLETTNEGMTNYNNLFAIGDISGGPWLAHKASHEAIKCINFIKTKKNTHKILENNIPGCIYSIPQIASIGFTEEQLISKKIKFKKGNFPFMANGKSQTINNVHGFVKTLFDEKTGELLGAHLIGPDVTELLSTFGIAMTAEATEEDFINTIFAHPTLSEAIHESVLSAFDKPIHF